MSGMFKNASSFNKNISFWNVSRVQFFENFRTGSSVFITINTPLRFVNAGQ